MGISINDVTHFTKYLGLWSNLTPQILVVDVIYGWPLIMK